MLYPEGNAKRNGNDHISLYLALAESNAISHGCQINVTLKFFIYDHIQDKYLIMQGRCIYLFFFVKAAMGISIRGYV